MCPVVLNIEAVNVTITSQPNPLHVKLVPFG